MVKRYQPKLPSFRLLWLKSRRIVYSKDVINLTNFYPILLKEWFFILKKEGYLVIDYLPNKILDTNSIYAFGGYGVKDVDLVYHGKCDSSSVY